MVVLGVQAGKLEICQQKPPLYREMTEPVPQGVHRAFELLLLLNGGHVWHKGKLLIFSY